MPIIKNADSGSLSREEYWVPTRSGDREKRSNGIVIKYYKEGSGSDWHASFENQPKEIPLQGMSMPLENFVSEVRKKADKLQPLK